MGLLENQKCPRQFKNKGCQEAQKEQATIQVLATKKSHNCNE
jgi:hypothetical protein